jgi:hypothetical protein
MSKNTEISKMLQGVTLTGNLDTPMVVTDSAMSMRNKLINAGFTINQRGYVSAAAVGAANTYTLDRWRVVTSGQSLSFSTSGNLVQVTAPAGGIEQVIEGSFIEGGVYTLSWTGTATATVNGSAQTNGGQTASLTAGSNVTIKFSSGTVLAPMFEKGSVATPFEHRHIGLERSLCERYYQKHSMGGGGFVVCYTTNAWVYGYPLPTRMRVTPTTYSLVVSASSFPSVLDTTWTNNSASDSHLRWVALVTGTAGDPGYLGTTTIIADAEL